MNECVIGKSPLSVLATGPTKPQCCLRVTRFVIDFQEILDYKSLWRGGWWRQGGGWGGGGEVTAKGCVSPNRSKLKVYDRVQAMTGCNRGPA